MPAFACRSVFDSSLCKHKSRFCMEYTRSLIHIKPKHLFSHSSHSLKLKQQRKKKGSVTHHTHTQPISPTNYLYLSDTLSSLLSLDNRLSHLSPYSLSVFMAASHSISCSPALFADGRDERDGAGWLLGYRALSTNGRPWQGRFHAPPPRRQPSEQHSHFSTLFLFPPLCMFLITFCLKRSSSQRSDSLLKGIVSDSIPIHFFSNSVNISPQSYSCPFCVCAEKEPHNTIPANQQRGHACCA